MKISAQSQNKAQMKHIAYIRVSTVAQSYDRQVLTFKEYFKYNNVGEVAYVTEKKTSYSSFKERAIYPVLENAEPGDTIYVCQLDRLGRSVQDVLDLVEYAATKGVVLVTIDNNQRIENQTPQGKMFLTMLAAFAEMERSLRAERCAAGKAAEREQLKKTGYRISRRSGQIQTRMGNAKGCDMSAAQQASAQAKQEQAIRWRAQSPAYAKVREWLARNWKREDMLAELQSLYEHTPDSYCTQSGKCITRSVLDRWCREIGTVAV